MKAKPLFVAGALSVTAIAAAFAHGGATGIVKERMDAMSAMSDVIKSLTPMMRGETDYDADLVRKGAATIRDHAGNTMTVLFPEGSSGEPSEAREEIWEDWEDFQALAVRLEALTSGLEKAANNGLMMSSGSGSGGSSMMGTGKAGADMMGGNRMMGSGMMGSGMMGSGMMDGPIPDAEALASMPADGLFNMVAQTCSACHTKFRLEKK